MGRQIAGLRMLADPSICFYSLTRYIGNFDSMENDNARWIIQFGFISDMLEQTDRKIRPEASSQIVVNVSL
jgi:hypothetical protein